MDREDFLELIEKPSLLDSYYYKSEERIGELANYVVKLANKYAFVLMGIEWELQGTSLAEKCKGNLIHFGELYLDEEDELFTGIYEDKRLCYVKFKLGSFADAKGIHKIYFDMGNIEVVTKMFGLEDMGSMLRDVNREFKNYFDDVILPVVNRNKLYPFALMVPSSYAKPVVSKHVNLGIWTDWSLISAIHVYGNIYYGEFSRHVAPEVKIHKNPEFSCGVTERSGFGHGIRFETRLPYNFRLYRELENVFWKVSIEALIESIMRNRVFIHKIIEKVGLLFRTLKTEPYVDLAYSWKEIGKYYNSEELVELLFIDILFVERLWYKNVYSAFYNRLYGEVDNIVEENERMYGTSDQPELLIYTKTGKTSVMPGKLY